MWLSGGALVQPGETDPGFHAHTEQAKAKATHLGTWAPAVPPAALLLSLICGTRYRCSFMISSHSCGKHSLLPLPLCFHF